MTNLTDRDRELVALGAAMGSNCVPCMEYHIPAARKARLSDPQIVDAVRGRQDPSGARAEGVGRGAGDAGRDGERPWRRAARFLRSARACRGEKVALLRLSSKGAP